MEATVAGGRETLFLGRGGAAWCLTMIGASLCCIALDDRQKPRWLLRRMQL